MNNGTRALPVFCLLCLFLSVLLSAAGCGGGGGGATGSSGAVTTRGTGSLTFTIVWPQKTRLIPYAANDIQVSVYTPGTGNTPSTTLAATPVLVTFTPGTTSKTVTINGLPPTSVDFGQYTVLAQAFATAPTATNGTTDPPLATGTVKVSVAAGQFTTVSLTMGSTLSELRLSGIASRSFIQGSTYIDGNATFDVNQNGNIYVDPSSTTNPQITAPLLVPQIPVDASLASAFPITVTALDSSGNVLLLATSASPTPIFSATGGASGNITVAASSSTGPNVPFTLQSTGNEGQDLFTVAYTDDGTVLNFATQVDAIADFAPTSTLTLINTPPDFDTGPNSGNVNSTITLTEVDGSNNPTGFTYTGTPTYGTASITYTFTNVRNHQRKFLYTYSLNGLTTSAVAVPFKTGTSPAAVPFPVSTPPAFANYDASQDQMLLTSFPVSANAATLNRAYGTTPSPYTIAVTAVFGSTTGLFSPNLFTVGTATDHSVPSATVSNYLTQVAPSTAFPSVLSQVTPITTLAALSITPNIAWIPLGLADRSSTGVIGASPTTGNFIITLPPNGGSGTGTGN